MKRLTHLLQAWKSKKTSLIRRPVRYTYSIALSVTVLSVAAYVVTNVTSSQPSRVSLSVSDSVIEAGSPFKIDVFVDAQSAVNAVSLDIQFDPEKITVLGVDRGQSVLTLWTEDPRVEDELVLLRGGTYRRGFIGRHLIATIRAEAVETGRATFAIKNSQLLSGDGTGTSLRVATQDNIPSVNIRPEGSLVAATDTAVRPLTDLAPDERVTMREISVFMAAWSNKSTVYDFDNDGKMTIRDFSILLYRFFANR